MSNEPRKPEHEVHFYVPAHLEPPELRGFTVLETNRATLTAVYWDNVIEACSVGGIPFVTERPRMAASRAGP
jgi:hypothetical protein